MNTRVTTETIAERCGVSPRTVYRALHDKSGIDKETKKRILKLANELNFRPNAIARSLVLRRTKTLGLLVPDITTSFYAQIIEGVEEAVSRQGYSLILGKTDFLPEREAAYIGIFQEKMVDGMILSSLEPRIINEVALPLQEKGKPIVLIDTYLKDAPIDSISVDNIKGAILAVDYLVKLGHQRIGFISDRVVTEERKAGYELALKKHRLPLDEKIVIRSKFREEEAGYTAVKKLLKLKDRPTAVFAARDTVAIGAIRAIKEAGLDVPDDVSVIGFDDINIAAFLSNPLTTIAQPKQEIGHKAAEILLENITQGTRKKTRWILLKPQLIARSTCKSIKNKKGKKNV